MLVISNKMCFIYCDCANQPWYHLWIFARIIHPDCNWQEC